jgi:LacI family transcriptional regulator
MPPTLEEVAKLAGVSRSTVSRVINDEPNVRAETRDRVRQAIRKSGYRPHAVARSLVTNRTQIIGMLIPETVTTLFTDPFFPLLLRGATEACNAHHYQLMLSLFTSRSAEQDMYQRVLGNGYLDGAIVASAAADDPLIPSLLHDRIQLVSVGRYTDERVPYVDVDNVGGGRMAVEHLIRLGHRRIAVITGRLDMTHARDRLSGYKQALQTHRISFDESLVAEGDYSENSGRTAMRQLLEAKPSAVFVSSDSMAIGALKALHEVGLSVPEDMALVGFDNIPLAAVMQPPLTTIRQPIERLGALAVDVLISMLQGPPDPGASAQRIVLPTELVIRQSCGALQESP